MDRLEHALRALELEYKVVCVRPNSKAAKYRNFPELVHTRAEVERHVGDLQGNWGILLRGLLVVDRDGASRRAYEWLRSNRVHRSPTEVETKHGTHFYFCLPGQEETHGKLKHLGMPVDLLTGNRFALGPGSEVDRHVYALREEKQLVPPTELPVFPAALLKSPERPPPPTLMSSLPSSEGKINDLHAYLCRIPSVQGQNGSRGLMRACFVVLDQGLDIVQALSALERWNSEGPVVPRWSQEELYRAYQNAIRRRTGAP